MKKYIHYGYVLEKQLKTGRWSIDSQVLKNINETNVALTRKHIDNRKNNIEADYRIQPLFIVDIEEE